MSLSKLSKKQEMNKKIDPNSERIAITCGDAGENHAGMEMLGKLGAQGSGFTTKDLINIKTFVEELKCKCDYYDLSNDEAVVVNKVKGKYVKTDKRKAAGVLVLRNFLNEETVNKVYKDITSVEWDTKYYDTRRGVVLNKLARENIVFLKGREQSPDYENKKGTIVDWTKLRDFNAILDTIFELINSVTESKAEGLIAEGNRYKKSKVVKGKSKKINNGIGWHGDAERRKVVCICIGGVDYCMKWQWFYKHRPLNNEPFEVFLNSGDIYIMSEEAVGQRWKSSSIYTLRHCAGPDSASPYVQYKKEWVEHLKKGCKEKVNEKVNKKINKKVSKKDKKESELEKIRNEVLESIKPSQESEVIKNKKLKVKRKKKKLKLKGSNKKDNEKIDLDNIMVTSIPTLTADNFVEEEKKVDVPLIMTDIVVPSDVRLPGEEIKLGETWLQTENNSIVAEWRGRYTDRRVNKMMITILHPADMELDLKWHDPMTSGNHVLGKKLFDRNNKIYYNGCVNSCSEWCNMDAFKDNTTHFGVWTIKNNPVFVGQEWFEDKKIYTNHSLSFT